MSVRKIGPGKYDITVDIGNDPVSGKRRQKREVFNGTQAEARRREGEIFATIGVMDYSAERMTIKDYLENTWLPAHKNRVERNTYAYYKRSCDKYIIPMIGSITLKNLNPDQVSRMLEAIEYTSSRLQAYKTLSVSLDHAVHRHRLMRSSPMIYVDKPTHETVATGRYSIEQAKTLLEMFRGDKIEAAVIIGLFTGLRREEYAGLDCQDIDYKNNLITVRRAYTVTDHDAYMKGTKTKSSDRIVPIAPEAAALLKLVIGPRIGPVLMKENGERMHPDTITRRFRRVIERYNREHAEGGEPFPYISLYNLRHTYASIQMELGAELTVLASLLGQTKTSTTLIYTKPMPLAAEVAAHRMGAKVLGIDGEILTNPHTSSQFLTG